MNDDSVKCKMCDENVVKKVDMNIHVKNIIKSYKNLSVSVLRRLHVLYMCILYWLEYFEEI